jgi:hypothetical protein
MNRLCSLNLNSEVVLQFMHTVCTQLKSILPTWRAAHQKLLCYCPPHFADCQHNWQTDHNSVTCRTFTDAEPIYIMQNFHSDSIYAHTSTTAVYTPLPSQSLCRSLEPVSFQPVHDAIKLQFTERVRVTDLLFTYINW